MLILLISYLGGLLTVLSPCILPVLPFVFARADRPFRTHGLPMLLGMALAFAAVASLAAVGGGWAVALNQHGRQVAMAVLALFGSALLFPSLAERISRPLVALGGRWSEPRAGGAGVFSPLLVGIGTGLLWTPCAGPILGLILAGAALGGAGAGSSLLLLAYAAGACTALAAALLFGGRLLAALKGTLPAGEWLRRGAGAAVLLGVAAIALGWDTGVLSRLSLATTTRLEQSLLAGVGSAEAGAPLRADAGPAGPLAALAGATEWINSPALTAAELRGKVVLIDFWTYSCINCLRTLPYLRAWEAKYRDAGLVVVGVHAPEFAFERQSANVQRAVKDLRIGFPVAIDNQFAIWRGFGNHYWPAFYFIDAQGRQRHQQFGEGGYEQSEQVIRQLLAEAGRTLPDQPAAPQGQGIEAAPGATPALSQETYLGHERARGFASPGGLVRDRVHDYPAAPALHRNQWALSGDWTVEPERAVLSGATGRIAYRFHARDLHLVLGPPADGQPLRFRVRLDGHAPGPDHGADIDAEGHGVIDGQRLYQLVRQAADGKDRLFEIEFEQPGAQAYVFTFG